MNTIGFKNFKAFGDTMQTFSNKPITLIYGPNSVGKSSILHALMYAKAVIGGANPDIMRLDDSIDLGGFKNFIHKHDENRKFEFEEEISEQYLESLLFADNTPYIWYNDYKIIKEPSKDCPLGNEPALDFSIAEIMEMSLENDENRFIQNCKSWENMCDVEFKKDFNIVKKWADEIIDYLFGIKTIKIKVEINNKLEKEFKLFFNDELFATALIGKINFNNDEENTYRILIDEKNAVYKAIAKKINYTKPLYKYNEKEFLDNLERRIERIKTFRDSEFSEKEYRAKNIEEYRNKCYISSRLLCDYSISVISSWISDIKDYNEHKNPRKMFGELANEWFSFFIGFYCCKRNTNYIEPLRYYPERNDLFSINLANNININKNNVWQELMSDNTDVLEAINLWLSNENKLNKPYKIQIRKFYEEDINNKNKILKDSYIKKIEFLDINNSTIVTPRDMGLGVSQVLPILCACYNDSSEIYVEQPELHLHPKQQCELADEFIMAVKSGKKKLYIETHSEHLLLRIMKRLRHSANGKIDKNDPLYITPDDICLLYVDNCEIGAEIKELELDDDGTLLDPFPNGFFEEGYKERFE